MYTKWSKVISIQQYMNIVVLIDYNEHRSKSWNGETIRYGSVGVSGTEQSFVLISEEFAKNSENSVVLISHTCIPDTLYKGVKYNIPESLKKYVDTTELLIIQSDNRYFIQYQWPKLKKLIFWYESQRFVPVEVLQLFSRLHPNCEIICNTMTNYGENYMKSSTPYVSVYLNDIFKAGNPLMMDLIVSSQLYTKEDNSFIFHAGFDRGGHIAYDAFRKLDYKNKKFYVCGYDTIRKMNISEQVVSSLESSDKSTLFNALAKSEYFIYPLVAPSYSPYNNNPPNSVHKDTFGCVIAEALAHEVIVITYPVGAVKEIYGDHLVYLPFPLNANISSLNAYEETFDPSLNSDEAVSTIIKTIKFLDSRPMLKDIIRKRGRAFVLEEFVPDKLFNKWKAII